MSKINIKPWAFIYNNIFAKSQTKSKLNKLLQHRPLSRSNRRNYLFPILCCSGYLYFNLWGKNNHIHCTTREDVQKFQTRRDHMKLQTITDGKKSYLSTVWSIICHVFRFFHLIFIFFPVAILYPFRNFKFMNSFWLDCFVKAVERAGVVWIKCFQYMSHRRDIIGQQMAHKFVHLREHAPEHSYQQTKKTFEKKLGKKIEDVFQEFDPKPIASGSVSQVYKAVYQGKKVAIKVRHPEVDKYIQRDINILFFFSRLLSNFSRAFRLPVSQVSMKKMLIDQIDFNNEKDNLLIFNQMFKGNEELKFPIPFIEQTNQSILVETFVQGVPITYFQQRPHSSNPILARRGAEAFFQMLMKNNFIHADCHGGNIIVSIQERKQNFFTEVRDFLKEVWHKVEDYITLQSLQSEMLKKLYIQSKKEEKEVHKLFKSCKQKIVVTLIDVGMVIRLDQRDRINFINFLKSILHGDGQKCAEMVYDLSIFDNKKIVKGKFQSYMAELKSLFGVLDGQPVEKLQGVQLLLGMLNIIRENNMKLEGQFATLLTNMLVLQAMAKQLHPQINILKCAVPYFRYAEDVPDYVMVDKIE